MREKIPYIVLTAKTAVGKEKLSYHGERWILKGKTEKLKFTRDPGPWLIVISRDGKKCIHIKEKDDLDFTTRML